MRRWVVVVACAALVGCVVDADEAGGDARVTSDASAVKADGAARGARSADAAPAFDANMGGGERDAAEGRDDATGSEPDLGLALDARTRPDGASALDAAASPDASAAPDARLEPDGGREADVNVPPEAGPGADALASSDVGLEVEAERVDADAARQDAAPPPDVAPPPDATRPDAAAPDAAAPDAAAPDAAAPDAAAPDAAAPDAAAPDGGPPDPCDLDGDGATGRACRGPDCDDGDPAIHPGAPDPYGDEVDSDCDGIDGVFVEITALCGPDYPGTRLVRLRGVRDPLEAAARGCVAVGARGAGYAAFLADVHPRPDPTVPDADGVVAYPITATLVHDGIVELPITALSAPALTVLVRRTVSATRFDRPVVAAGDTAWPWRARVEGPLVGTHLDARGDGWPLPPLFGPRGTAPRLHHARLQADLSIEGSGFAMRDATLSGVIPRAALRDAVAAAERFCEGRPGDLDCGPFALARSGDVDVDTERVAASLGGYDARLGVDGALACDPAAGDCDALTVCLALDFAPADCLEEDFARLGNGAAQPAAGWSEPPAPPGRGDACEPHDARPCGEAGACRYGDEVRGTCVQACRGDADCRLGHLCSLGYCRPSCFDAPCDYDELCDRDTGRCVDVYAPCAEGCGAEARCHAGRCVRDDRACAADEQCSPGLGCVDGQCDGDLYGRCERDVDCPVGATCDAWICQPR
ncbi:MAG: putative metal-binding motif-containing protein [Myxococcales bacterium]|nr:putative metal-binding motif-containing protein [Myxococcales bacterium]